MNTQPPFVLVDGSSYLFRAFHALPPLTNSHGEATGAIVGVINMLRKLIDTYHPSHIAVVFDAPGKTFRDDLYAEYKAHRPPMPDELVLQLPFIKKVTAGFNIPDIEMAGYEADDLIGTYAGQAEQSGFAVTMVTGDKDFVQLVTDQTIIWDPMKDVIFTREDVQATGIEPDQLVDVMGLSGDSSDNIPGVPGIGPKTALALIKTFGSMEHLYTSVDTITKKKQH